MQTIIRPGTNLIIPTPGVHVLQPAVASSGVEYLLHAEFETDEAAPMTDPHVGDPGPGSINVDSLAYTSGGAIYSDDELTGEDGIDRAAGVAFAWYKNDTLDGNVLMGFAGSGTPAGPGMFYVAGGILWIQSNSGGRPEVLDAAVDDTDHCVVARLSGYLFFIKNPTWRLVWVNGANTTDPIYPGMKQWGSGFASQTYWKTFQMATPFDTDDGYASYTDDGPLSPGGGDDTFTHEANSIIEFAITTLPTSGELQFRFREQDTSNYWVVEIDSSKHFRLYEVVSGSPTQRGAGWGVANAGDRVVIRMYGSEIVGHIGTDTSSSDGCTMRWDYESATNFQTETDGRFVDAGSGWQVDDFKVWPSDVSGAALAELEAYL